MLTTRNYHNQEIDSANIFTGGISLLIYSYNYFYINIRKLFNRSQLFRTPEVLKYTLMLLLFVGLNLNAYAQEEDADQKNYHFRGNISANYNGISLVPSFSLGRPAFIFDLSLGGDRLTFDPEMRFAMDGKPWSFILWWRYQVVRSKKFSLRAGVHPAFVFREISPQNNSGSAGTGEAFTVGRYFAGELAPTYNVNKNFRIGLYYLHALGLDPGLNQHTQFLAINSGITQIPLSKQFYINLSPQVFYLKIDELDGFYTSGSMAISKKDFPFAISALVSKKIASEIPGNDLVWNVGLVYTFNRDYLRKPAF